MADQVGHDGEIPGQAGDDVEVAGDDEDRPSLPA